LEAENDAWSHAYLFVGNDIDQINNVIDFIVAAKKCPIGDIVRLKPEEKDNKSGEIKGEQVKAFLHQISLTASNGSKIGIIENCDKLNVTSSNVLLKTIEEPPKNVTIILVSRTESVIATIKSRCRIYHFGVGEEANHNYSYENLFAGSLIDGFKKIEEIVKSEDVMDFLDGLSNYLLTKATKEHSTELANLVEETQLVKKKIKGNANQRLTLENLFLDIKDHI